MIHFEQPYSRFKNSWLTTLVSLGITGILFSALTTTQLGLKKEDLPETTPVTVFLPPPPESESSNEVPLASNNKPDFNFDTQEVQLPEDIPLDFINVPLGPVLNPVIDTEFELKTSLDARRPEFRDRMLVLENTEVDQPVRAEYIPGSNLPYHLSRDGGELYVLYRVNAKGRAENIHILTTTNPELNPYAERLLRRVRFRAARHNGEPVSTWVQHALRFLKGPQSPFVLQ